jgi:hypothetical protein
MFLADAGVSLRLSLATIELQSPAKLRGALVGHAHRRHHGAGGWALNELT